MNQTISSQKVLIINFGGQYDQLIARRVRECHVYCEVKPYTVTLEEIKAFHPIGIIFTGGPQSVYAQDSYHPAEGIFELGVPILGICYGCQLLAYHLGGKVTAAQGNIAREFGKTKTVFDTACLLFEGLPQRGITWMSHGDYMEKIPNEFRIVAYSDSCAHVAIADEKRGFYGVQFHPEVTHTSFGSTILHNFLFRICHAAGDWDMEQYLHQAIAEIREKVGNEKVLLALSGGVDSSVCAALFAEAIGKQLTCVFVDHGLMRKGEADQVEQAFSKWDVSFIRINVGNHFLNKLSGITDPEEKRKIIGEEFIHVFETMGKQLDSVSFLAQGTIYPDVIESGTDTAEMIKSHHNVGGLPKYIDFKEIIEPLRMLFKDEVRQLGYELGVPEYLVNRQPFPGPGLAIRIIGEVTEEKLEILREADAIFHDEINKAGLDTQMSQYFAVLTNLKSVGVMGDGRTYDYAVALRAVMTDDFMTADWARIPHDVLDRVSVRIVNEVPHVNRVLYDITSKPPATVEFE